MTEHHLSEGDDGSVVDARVGDMIDVRLREMPSGGYRWQLDGQLGGVLEALDPEYEFAAGRVGGASIARFRFRVQVQGRTEMRLAYRRSWEAGEPPLRTYELRIAARG